MGWFNGNPEEDLNKLFTPNGNLKLPVKDKYWDRLLIAIFIIIAIGVVSITLQATFN